MNALKNILIVIGIITLIGLIALLILGAKVLGTVFVWLLGIVAFFVIIGAIIYYIGRSSGKRSIENP